MPYNMAEIFFRSMETYKTRYQDAKYELIKIFLIIVGLIDIFSILVLQEQE